MSDPTELKERVLQLAIAWWQSHKPKGMADGDYMRSPTAGCTDTDIPGKRLSRAVGEYVRDSWRVDATQELLRDVRSLLDPTGTPRVGKLEALRRIDQLLGVRHSAAATQEATRTPLPVRGKYVEDT